MFVLITFILIAVLFRLIPHLPNFTPVTAIALFGGIYFSNKKMAYLIPLFIMAISDTFLGFHTISLFVYVAFLLVCFIGSQANKPTVNIVLANNGYPGKYKNGSIINRWEVLVCLSIFIIGEEM